MNRFFGCLCLFIGFFLRVFFCVFSKTKLKRFMSFTFGHFSSEYSVRSLAKWQRPVQSNVSFLFHRAVCFFYPFALFLSIFLWLFVLAGSLFSNDDVAFNVLISDNLWSFPFRLPFHCFFRCGFWSLSVPTQMRKPKHKIYLTSGTTIIFLHNHIAINIWIKISNFLFVCFILR